MPHNRDRSSFQILGDTELQALCDSSCQSDLAVLRSTIATSCTQSSDVMVPGDIAYPGKNSSDSDNSFIFTSANPY